ncbi:MAG TPA: ATP-dependent sacrificial sulfur transferase LarE [Longimicrobiales bacterium]|nr:ATP-dependent sacrificial sulfur transferase LarE [Longimicrobiales bacterium]
MEELTNETGSRYQRLQQILRELGSVCVGYSGGVDSVFLSVAAVQTLGPERVLAVTGRSASVPGLQLDVARQCAREFGVPHVEIDTDELDDPNYAANPSNRCYFCKSELWSQLRAVADEHGIAAVVDGANADDASDYRPGAQAALENSVRSPMQEAGLTKRDIRMLSHMLGLPTWDQPAAPCLASRLPYGLAVTRERLSMVERAEENLRSLGLREFRVRHHGDAARLELIPQDIERAAAEAGKWAAAVRAAGFTRVLLDVHGYRRGALNEVLPLVQLGRA